VTPWFRRKRWWPLFGIGGLFVLLVIIGAIVGPAPKTTPANVDASTAATTQPVATTTTAKRSATTQPLASPKPSPPTTVAAMPAQPAPLSDLANPGDGPGTPCHAFYSRSGTTLIVAVVSTKPGELVVEPYLPNTILRQDDATFSGQTVLTFPNAATATSLPVVLYVGGTPDTTGDVNICSVAPGPGPSVNAPAAPAAPASAGPPNEGVVHPGAFCTPDGATGMTDRGTAMTCDTTPSDARDRWRASA